MKSIDLTDAVLDIKVSFGQLTIIRDALKLARDHAQNSDWEGWGYSEAQLFAEVDAIVEPEGVIGG